MSPATSYDWIYAAIGYPVALASFFWLLWTLFRDRSRGRRRCPRCWYSMDGAPGLICPECGHAARSEKRFYKTRRRYRHAAIASFLLIAALATTLVPAYQRGWTTVVPSWLLVRIAEPRSLNSAVIARVISMTNGGGAPPPSPPTTVAEALVLETWSRFDTGALSIGQYRHWIRRCMAAADADLTNSFTPPDAWPTDEGMPILVSLPSFPGSDFLDIRLRAPDLSPDWAAPTARRIATNLAQVQLPAPARPLDELRLEVQLVGRRTSSLTWNVVGSAARSPEPIAGKVICSAEFTVPVRVCLCRDSFLDPVSGPDADAAVLSALSPRLSGTDFLRLAWDDTSDHAVWESIDFGIYFNAEVRVGDQLVGRTLGHADWARPVWRDWEDAPIAWQPDGRGTLERARADPSGPEPRLILRADPAAAAAAYLERPFSKPRPACWAGSLDISLRLHPPQPNAPP